MPLGKELPNQVSFSKDKGQEPLLVTDTTTILLNPKSDLTLEMNIWYQDCPGKSEGPQRWWLQWFPLCSSLEISEGIDGIS